MTAYSYPRYSKDAINNIINTIIFITTYAFDVTSSFVFAQREELKENHSDNSAHNIKEASYNATISSITEWLGIFALGITAGTIAVSVKDNHDNLANFARRILVSIGVLSIASGIIHLLLIQEHAQEDAIWGIIFIINGIAQTIFGMIIVLIVGRRLSLIGKSVLYYIGIVGNALLISIFVFARLFVSPFSSEGTPVNELETNGIITLIIEMLTIILVVYMTKLTRRSQRNKKLIW